MPIDILNNDTAKLYTHIHPILVLSFYVFRFSAIVADPVSALTSSLIPLSFLQIAYVAICLPPTGGSNAQEKKKPGEKKKPTPGKLESGVNSKVIVSYSLPYDNCTSCTGHHVDLVTNSLPSSLSSSPPSPRLLSSQPPSFSSAHPLRPITHTRSSAAHTFRFSEHCL